MDGWLWQTRFYWNDKRVLFVPPNEKGESVLPDTDLQTSI